MEATEIKRGPGRPPKNPPSVATVDTMRPALHQEMRDESPQDAAARRAKEILAQLGDSLDEPDEFYVPAHLKDPDWDYNWKRWSAANAEDPSYINSLLRTGWEFVSAKTPGMEIFLPRGWKEDFILKKGMVLMKRPMQITELVNKRLLDAARQQLNVNQAKLRSEPIAGAPRDNNGTPIGSRGVSGAKTTIVGPIPD